MEKMIEQTVNEEQGFRLHLITSKKFKTLHFVVKFRAPLQRETITKRAILPYILQQGTKSYPTEQELQLQLDRLYGAVLSIDGAKKGSNHIMSFRLEIANQKFITSEESILDEAIKLLNEVIYHPNTDIDGNSFQANVFDREKETLKNKMNAIVDDKIAYANMRLIDEMCKKEAYGLHVHGYEEDLATLHSAETYRYYQKMLTEDALDVYVLGDFEQRTMKEKLNKIFSSSVTKDITEQNEFIKDRKETQVIIEEQPIQQAKLHLGYRTYCRFSDDHYFALQVFNGLFGGFPSSKLFTNVREKNSLAYYAASRLESHQGLLLVYSGIDADDYTRAREIIEQQMEAMKNGEFTTVEVEETKELIISQLLETLDSPQGIIELLYQQVIGNKQLPPNEFINQLKQVTKDDVVNVAQQITEDTIYLLTNKRGEAVE